MFLSPKQLPAPKTVITVKHQAKSKTFVWSPQIGEKVVYLHTDSHGNKSYSTGIYLGLWMERNNSKEASPYLQECLPYCGKPENQVFRAFVLDISGGFSDYPTIENIGEFTWFNIEWAHEQNRLMRLSLDTELEAAFGKVEAA